MLLGSHRGSGPLGIKYNLIFVQRPSRQLHNWVGGKEKNHNDQIPMKAIQQQQKDPKALPRESEENSEFIKNFRLIHHLPES